MLIPSSDDEEGVSTKNCSTLQALPPTMQQQLLDWLYSIWERLLLQSVGKLLLDVL